MRRAAGSLAAGLAAVTLAAGAWEVVPTGDGGPRVAASPVSTRAPRFPDTRSPVPPASEAASAPAAAPTSPAGGRVPALLVPGWFNGADAMEPLRDRLLAAGWEPEDVVAFGFDDPVASNRVHARELARAVVELKERTGAPRVDVVAHSMGGLALRYYLWNGGDEDVRRAVFLATPHRGTVSAFLAWGGGAEEMRPGSPFLVAITRAPVLPPGVEALTVRTPLDLHVLPAESATLPGVPDVEVCCPTHEGMLDDDETFEAVRRFLDGG